ncbi:44651_t:CDS:1, partial [Gigaspora margarita]
SIFTEMLGETFKEACEELVRISIGMCNISHGTLFLNLIIDFHYYRLKYPFLQFANTDDLRSINKLNL